jgi:hypothetical protein
MSSTKRMELNLVLAKEPESQDQTFHQKTQKK